MLTGKELVNYALIGLGRSIGQKIVDFLRRRGQTDHVKVNPSQQRDAVRVGRKGKVVPFQLPQHESINGGTRAAGVLDFGQHWTLGWLKRPVSAVGGIRTDN